MLNDDIVNWLIHSFIQRAYQALSSVYKKK